MTVHIHSSLAAASWRYCHHYILRQIFWILILLSFRCLLVFPFCCYCFSRSLSYDTIIIIILAIVTRSCFPTILRQGSMVLSQAPSDESSGYDRETIAKRDAKRRFVSYLWDTLDKPYEERRLLFKLDAALLSFASLGGWHGMSALNALSFLSFPLLLINKSQKVTSSSIWIKWI